MGKSARSLPLQIPLLGIAATQVADWTGVMALIEEF